MVLRCFPVVALILWCLAAAGAAAAPEELLGKVRVPKGVNPALLEVFVHSVPAQEIENGPKALSRTAVGSNGFFRVSAEPAEGLNIEITGPGVRRARFPWPPPRKPGEQPVFELQPGVVLYGQVFGPDNKPAANALAGPIVPGSDVSAEGLRTSYPFFVRTDRQGMLMLTGLLPDTTYEFPLHAPGFERTRISWAPGSAYSVRLRPGGQPLAGSVLWEGSLQPAVGSTVRLLGGPREFVLQRVVGPDGSFRFDNLPAGDYQLAPAVEGIGELRPRPFGVMDNKGIEKIVLTVRDGITIDATVADVETGEPIAKAPVTLRNDLVYTRETGRFRAEKVRGPWPLKVTIDAPLYDFRPEDQDINVYPFNGYNGDDILGATLYLRRQRVLEIVTADGEKPQDYPSALAEIWGPVESTTDSTRERIAPQDNLVKLLSAGTRYVVVRTTEGQVSDLLEAHTAVADTTTTLLTTLGPEARLEAMLTFREDNSPVSCRMEVVREVPGERRLTLGGGPLDLRGSLIVAQLPPGEATVRFLRSEGQAWLEEKVELKRGETLTLNRQVSRGVTIAGRVVEEGTGRELAEIPIACYGTDPEGKPLNLQTMTKEKGLFRLEGFGPPVLRELRINHAQYAPAVLTDVALPLEKDLEIALKPREGLTVTLDSAAPALVTARAYVLLGREQPAAEGLSQWFFEQEQSEAFAGKPSVMLTPRSSGRLRVAAEAEGRWDVSEPFEWSESSPAREIRLSPRHTASLEVTVDGLDDAALAALDVALVNTTLPQSAGLVESLPTTRGSGRLTFADLPAGNYFLVASTADGATAALNNIEIAGGQRASASLALESPSLELAGRVTIGSGDQAPPADGARIVVRFGDVPEAEALAETATDSQGRFSVAPLPSRRPYLVEVNWQELRRSFPVEAAPAGTPRVDRDFVLAMPVSVTVTLPAGASGGEPWLLMAPDGSEVLPVQPGQPMRLSPGTWTVARGERHVGTVRIDPSTTEVQLPAAP